MCACVRACVCVCVGVGVGVGVGVCGWVGWCVCVCVCVLSGASVVKVQLGYRTLDIEFGQCYSGLVTRKIISVLASNGLAFVLWVCYSCTCHQRDATITRSCLSAMLCLFRIVSKCELHTILHIQNDLTKNIV